MLAQVVLEITYSEKTSRSVGSSKREQWLQDASWGALQPPRGLPVVVAVLAARRAQELDPGIPWWCRGGSRGTRGKQAGSYGNT